MRFLLSQFAGRIAFGAMIAMIFLAGWLLQLVGKDRGRWQSLTMFLPALVLFATASALYRKGHTHVSVFVLSGLAFLFGIVILIIG
jgi:hypothetical protein